MRSLLSTKRSGAFLVWEWVRAVGSAPAVIYCVPPTEGAPERTERDGMEPFLGSFFLALESCRLWVASERTFPVDGRFKGSLVSSSALTFPVQMGA